MKESSKKNQKQKKDPKEEKEVKELKEQTEAKEQKELNELKEQKNPENSKEEKEAEKTTEQKKEEKDANGIQNKIEEIKANETNDTKELISKEEKVDNIVKNSIEAKSYEALNVDNGLLPLDNSSSNKNQSDVVPIVQSDLNPQEGNVQINLNIQEDKQESKNRSIEFKEAKKEEAKNYINTGQLEKLELAENQSNIDSKNKEDKSFKTHQDLDEKEEKSDKFQIVNETKNQIANQPIKMNEFLQEIEVTKQSTIKNEARTFTQKEVIPKIKESKKETSSDIYIKRNELENIDKVQ